MLKQGSDLLRQESSFLDILASFDCAQVFQRLAIRRNLFDCIQKWDVDLYLLEKLINFRLIVQLLYGFESMRKRSRNGTRRFSFL